MMSTRIRTRAAVVLLPFLLSIGLAQPLAAAKPEATGDYVFQERAPKALKDAKKSVLQGRRNADGSCHYDYPEITAVSREAAIEVRDLGIDHGRCRKLIEQGISTEEPGPAGEGEDRVTATFDDPGATLDSSGAALAATSTASGYNWTWWEDILGIKMTQDRTNISWSFNGSCALTGSTSGEWSWATGTGWQIVSYSGSEYEICSYYRGTTVSTFKNSWFCAPLPTVYTYYYYVRAFGQENGTITGTRSTDSVDECAPFWMHYQVRKVT